ncbi:hypothetical protein W97_07655 [Coniosporium apollinis CBS 100218]|uniref:Uncharacterized protein n=1 Tax=Coniosporium apollinis (strain CBS 100218) TaxID=1168221 RepID=R7Z2M7_CONA1|nr:uncharacterized protein W97_07655 [Coniosporium apollinis CBS 100218]EON68445.1 hypothetical protein W97_07655 [Coniosporium apollinis CBS 100218]
MHYSFILPLAAAAMQLFGMTTARAISGASTLEVRSEANALVVRSEGANILDHVVPFPFEDNEENERELERVFDAIVNVPDNVLEAGQDRVKAWVAEVLDKNKDNDSGNDNDKRTVDLVERQSLASILACAYELGKWVVENVGAGKFRRVKELISLLGGARRVAKLLLSAKGWREVRAIGGPYLVELVEILTGAGGVVEACFGWV